MQWGEASYFTRLGYSAQFTIMWPKTQHKEQIASEDEKKNKHKQPSPLSSNNWIWGSLQHESAFMASGPWTRCCRTLEEFGSVQLMAANGC